MSTANVRNCHGYLRFETVGFRHLEPWKCNKGFILSGINRKKIELPVDHGRATDMKRICSGYARETVRLYHGVYGSFLESRDQQRRHMVSVLTGFYFTLELREPM